MDRKLSVVANVRYQSPKGKGASKLKGLLRYFQYRDDRDGHIPQQEGLERWVDHGLGRDFQTVAATCEAFKSEHVQAFTLVINPNPDLTRLVPEERRETFVKDLTERTVEQFLEARGIDSMEYSYVFHRRETRDKDNPGRDDPHTHVVLPGTFDSFADGARIPLYMNRNKRENHIELLHTIAQQQIDLLLQREIGRDWELKFDMWTYLHELAHPIPGHEPQPPQALTNPFSDTIPKWRDLERLYEWAQRHEERVEWQRSERERQEAERRWEEQFEKQRQEWQRDHANDGPSRDIPFF